MFSGGRPGNPILVGEAFGDRAQSAQGTKELQAGFAYLSVSGLEAFRKGPGGQDWLPAVRARWLVGLDGGITEPAALKMLHRMANTSVRVHPAIGKLSRRSLRASPKFHAKVARLRSGTTPTSQLLWVGSANATGSALGTTARNFEASWTESDGATLAANDAVFDAWWADAWAVSKPLGRPLIRAYTELRTKTLRKNAALLEAMEQPSPEDVGKATTLWMDVGSASGGSRNQIEFSETLAAFFGPAVKVKREVDIVRGPVPYAKRPLNYKKTTYGVDIWRLGLPTSLKYPGKRILLRKLSSAGTTRPRFKLHITSPDSAKAKAWFANASKEGHVGVTRGTSPSKPPRAFGYF